jgi:hypothetical protein
VIWHPTEQARPRVAQLELDRSHAVVIQRRQIEMFARCRAQIILLRSYATA